MSRRKLKTIFFALVCIIVMFICTRLFAAEDIVLRIDADPDEPWVGQKVTLHVDVLAKDGWARIRKVGDAEITGGYLLRLESQGTRLAETINGGSYTGQRYEVLFFGQRSGDLRIPEIPIIVEIKRWGGNAETVSSQLRTPAKTIQVRLPDGAEGMNGLISTTEFNAKQQWVPHETKVEVGDAITRTVTFSAADVSGMVFAPLVHHPLNGIGLYPGQPVVEDGYNRGNLSGKRIEKITYVFEREGEYTLPGLTYPWWDVKNEELKHHELLGFTVTVEGGAVANTPAIAAPLENRHIYSLVAVLGVCIIGAVLYRLRKLILSLFLQWRNRIHESELLYFKAISKAVHDNETKAVLRTTMQWLDRISTGPQPARLDIFLQRYGEESAQLAATRLMEPLSEHESAAILDTLHKGLIQARRQWKKAQRRSKKAEKLLPEIGLNRKVEEIDI